MADIVITNKATVELDREIGKDHLSSEVSGLDGDNNMKPQDKNTRKGHVYLWVLGFLAWFGYFNAYAIRNYVAAFLITFAEKQNLNKTACTFASATFQIATMISPILVKKLNFLGSYSLRTRSIIYAVFVTMWNSLTVLIDYLVVWDPKGISMYILFTVSRILQGAGTGALFVIMQGEIVDVFFRGNALVAGIISSAIHVPPMVGGIISAALYERGGWTAAALMFSGFMMVPVLVLPWINFSKIPRSESLKTNRVNGTDETLTNETIKKLSFKENIIFAIPDVVIFFANVAFTMTIYIIPFRLMESSDGKYTLTMANVLLSSMSVVSFLSAFLLSYIATRGISTLFFILVGNVCYFSGIILIYGATTDFMSFTGAFEIGVVLAGFGDAAVTNLCIPSKFDLYKDWKMDNKTLGVKASTTLNTALGSSAVLGVVLSSFVASPKSEIPTLLTNGTVLLGTSAALLYSIIRK